MMERQQRNAVATSRHWLPGLAGTVVVPDNYAAAQEDDETLVLYPINVDFVTFRITTLSAVTVDQPTSLVSTLRNGADDLTIYTEDNSERFLRIEAPQPTKDDDATIQFAYLATASKLVLLSLTIDDARQSDPIATEARELLRRVIRSIELHDRPPLRNGAKLIDFEKQQRKLELVEEDTKALNMARRTAINLASWKKFEYPMTPAQLDELFLLWAENPANFNGLLEKDQVLGVAFGDYLVAEFGLDWSMYEDEQGRDLAIVSDQPGLMLFPINSVTKRDVPEDAGFFTGIDEYVRSEYFK